MKWFLGGVVLGWVVTVLARRTGRDTRWDGPVYPPADPDDPLGLLTGDCGPAAFREVHRCGPGCNPSNCPREDF